MARRKDPEPTPPRPRRSAPAAPPRTPAPPRGSASRSAAPSRSAPAPRPATRPSARPLQPQRPAPTRGGGFAGLFRNPGGVLGQIGQMSGIDGPARSLDRLATSAERAADHLDVLDREIGVDRVREVLDRIEEAAYLIEDIHRAIRRIEEAVVDARLDQAGPRPPARPGRRAR